MILTLLGKGFSKSEIYGMTIKQLKLFMAASQSVEANNIDLLSSAYARTQSEEAQKQLSKSLTKMRKAPVKMLIEERFNGKR